MFIEDDIKLQNGETIYPNWKRDPARLAGQYARAALHIRDGAPAPAYVRSFLRSGGDARPVRSQLGTKPATKAPKAARPAPAPIAPTPVKEVTQAPSKPAPLAWIQRSRFAA